VQDVAVSRHVLLSLLQDVAVSRHVLLSLLQDMNTELYYDTKKIPTADTCHEMK
jgi:hypothetical protein